MKYSIWIFIYMVCFPFLAMGQIYNTEIKAAIDLEVQDNRIIEITASAHNKTQISKSLSYVLSVIKSGKNQNTNKQQDRFVLEPGAKKNLSQSSINVNGNDRTIILLLIYEDEKIVGKDRKVLNGIEGEQDEVNKLLPSKAQEDIKNSDEDGFVLRGVVVEDMKTKAGNDFYDMFYSSYLSNNINGEKVVKVEEKIAIGNTTQISVQVGDEVIVQFFVNPRNEYLKAMANQSIYRVNAHFQGMKDTKNQITRY